MARAPQGPDGGSPQPGDRLRRSSSPSRACSSSRSRWCRRAGTRGGAAGILWIAIAFAGHAGAGPDVRARAAIRNLRALLLAPAATAGALLGKLLGIVALLAADRVVLVPLVTLLFQAPLLAAPVAGADLVAGTIGFAAVGTLFAAMLVRVRSRDVLLPVLLYPITVPVIIAGVRATAALLEATAGRRSHRGSGWRCSRASTWSSSRSRSGRSSR